MSARRVWISTLVGLLCLVGAAFLSLSLGTVRLSFAQTLDALLRPGQAEPTVSAVIWSIRFPRIVVAMLVGAALAVVGAVMQAILRNPLAEPGITGVSGGAAVGAVAGITFGLGGTSQWGIPLAAFAGAAVVSLVLQLVLQLRRDIGSATIILVGVSLSALSGALIHVLIAIARDDAVVRSALFWLAGDLDLRSWDHVWMAVVPIVLGVSYLLTRVHALDALSLGEQTAATSGVNVWRERIVLLLVTSLVTGAAVAVSGVMSFVGLVVPHAVRLIVGASHTRLLHPSALVGAPIFLALLLRRRPV